MTTATGLVIQRVWAMPNKWTYQVPPIADLVRRYVKNGTNWADPFAGQSRLAEFRNDLNPANKQPNCMEALDFMQMIRSFNIQLDGVLLDPPYSLTQVSRSYQDIGLKFKGKENPTGGFPRVRDEIAAVVRRGGQVISFGWNTVGIGKTRGFEQIEVLIVCHGGNRNDTLCVVERKL